MTENNTILIDGGTYALIKKALQNWLKLYAENLQNDFTFELFKNGRGKHIIKADSRLDNENFNYLVNYLHYPEDVEYQAKIHGFTTARDSEVFSNEIIGKSILVTVPDNDKDYDCVYVVTQDNQPMKVDFGGRIEKLALQQKYYEPDIELEKLEKPVVLKPTKASFSKERQNAITQNSEELPAKGYLYFALWLIGFAVLLQHNLNFAGTVIAFGFSYFLLITRKKEWCNDRFRWIVTTIFFITGIVGLATSTTYDYKAFFWLLTVPFIYNSLDRFFKSLSFKYHGRDFYLYIRGSEEINSFGKNPHIRATDVLFSIGLFLTIAFLVIAPVFFNNLF